MVNAMHPSQRFKNTRVIQILGGVGSPTAEVHATQVTRRLADLIGAEATLLPAPGVVGSRNAREVLMKDRFVREALDLFGKVTLALVGIGATEPSRALASSGNIFSPQEIKLLAGKGAVGDICLRFFDSAGRGVITELNERVISMELDQLRAVRRVVGVAGGKRKTNAIRGALAGRLIKVLITDLASAERLLTEGNGTDAATANGSGRKASRKVVGTRCLSGPPASRSWRSSWPWARVCRGRCARSMRKRRPRGRQPWRRVPPRTQIPSGLRSYCRPL